MTNLDEKLKKAVEAFNDLSPEQKATMLEEQRQSWVRGNVGLSRDERGITTPIMPKNTRPAAPVEGLERYGQNWHDEMEPKNEGDYVLFSQAEAIIAAKDKKLESFAFFVSKLSALIPISKAIPALKTLGTMIDYFKGVQDDNAALTAQLKELKGEVFHDQALGITWKQICEQFDKECTRHQECFQTQLAAAQKALEFYADIHKYPAPLTGGMGDLWRDCGETAKKALEGILTPTHTHLKRGSSYHYFGTGTFQTDSWVYPHQYVDMGEAEEDMLSCDMQQVAVYLEADGTIWVRPVGEFNDGRFAKIEDDQ